jgi:hypothetical protein
MSVAVATAEQNNKTTSYESDESVTKQLTILAVPALLWRDDIAVSFPLWL